MTAPTYFNPRSREGSDSLLCEPFGVVAHFNPRSREGSDKEFGNIHKRGNISIHAPVKGATLAVRIAADTGLHFNPRSREGSDPSPSLPDTVSSIFQSTLP